MTLISPRHILALSPNQRHFHSVILTTNGHEGSKKLTVVEVPLRGTLTVVDSCLDAAVHVFRETIVSHCKPPSTTVNGSPCKSRLIQLTPFGPDTLEAVEDHGFHAPPNNHW